jgi:hypothetical protein
MQSSKHLAALGLLGAFGILIAAGSNKPAQRFEVSIAPPADRQQMAIVAAHVVSASDVCVRANAPEPNTVDAASMQALRDACTRAAEDQAKDLNWRDDDWEIVHPGTDSVEPAPRKMGTPRVARRMNAGTAEEPATRNR